ncbi:hypothetical protein [Lactobacillus acetotolerans]|uniref:hypothetical protein n=1 Tax=Lactobacillus acetotolerans TaxID=1600 RepID=UPI0019D315ED|nr:hypothetical protein [Lactobacillus acetotolerans]MBN7277044.1 hypothetical protein [Lactobacillus acetotolerans]
MKKFKGLIINSLLLMGGLSLFDVQPVKAAISTAHANKIVKKYHLKRYTVQKRFRGYWHGHSKSHKIGITSKWIFTAKHIYVDSKYKKVPIYKTSLALEKKAMDTNLYYPKMMFASSDKQTISLSIRSAYGCPDRFELGNKHGYKTLTYFPNGSQHFTYYKSKKLSKKYADN